MDKARPIYVDDVEGLTIMDAESIAVTVRAGAYAYRCSLPLETAAKLHAELARVLMLHIGALGGRGQTH